MRNRALLMSPLVALGAILGTQKSASAEVDTSSCIICDDWYNETQEQWWHTDYFLFVNDRIGPNHGPNQPFSCASHQQYCPTCPPVN